MGIATDVVTMLHPEHAAEIVAAGFGRKEIKE
jgi:hypothetical protein